MFHIIENLSPQEQVIDWHLSYPFNVLQYTLEAEQLAINSTEDFVT